MSSLLRLSPDAQHDALAALAERELGAKLLGLDSIAPGLGNRRFFRLHLTPLSLTPDPPHQHAEAHRADTPSSVIARIEADEDPEKRATGVAPEPPLEPVRSFLEQAGIPVPKRYGTDSDLGVELIEDVGARSLEQFAQSANPEQRTKLYAEACSLIPRLQKLEAPTPPIAAFERRLDRALIESKATRILDWALPWWLKRDPSDAECEVVRQSFSHIADVCDDAPMRLSHRDMKAANIHLRETAPDGERLVLIDLQGAFMAPPEYDLVCLLRDSHVPLPSEEVAQHIDATRPELPDAPEPEVFDRRFNLLTLSRVGKDAAHYIHAFTESGDARYLPLLPTAREVLREFSARAASMDPALGNFADLIHELREPENAYGGERS
jgi:aminoglycoside/choline kinase family phosphotransferase